MNVAPLKKFSYDNYPPDCKRRVDAAWQDYWDEHLAFWLAAPQTGWNGYVSKDEAALTVYRAERDAIIAEYERMQPPQPQQFNVIEKFKSMPKERQIIFIRTLVWLYVDPDRAHEEKWPSIKGPLDDFLATAEAALKT